jgi:putative transposase
MTRFRCIQRLRGDYPIQLLCALLDVSRSGFYTWCRRMPGPRAQENATLLAAIRKVHQQSRETYGSPRVHAALVRAQLRCGRHRVARLMRADGLRGLPQRRRVRTTQRTPGAQGAPDRLERDFSAAQPNQKWVSDITYIPTSEGWLYVAMVLDLFSRRIVGWAMADHMRAELVLEALQMAYLQRGAPHDLIYHSDHGGQYTSGLVLTWLAKRGIQASMGSTGDCYDNAVAESFFATLKRECVQRQLYATRREARGQLFEFIEVFYNRQRLHSTLGYQSPADYEEQACTLS